MIKKLKKKLKKLERVFEKTPEDCILTRQRILKKAENLEKKIQQIERR